METTKNTVLVVEDDSALREVFSDLLRLSGYDVLEAESGEQALEVVDSNPSSSPIKVILSDMHLPRMSGLHLLSHCREHPKTANTAFVVLTADTSLAGEAKSKGATDVLFKPFHIQDLQDLLEKY